MNGYETRQIVALSSGASGPCDLEHQVRWRQSRLASPPTGGRRPAGSVDRCRRPPFYDPVIPMSRSQAPAPAARWPCRQLGAGR